MKMLPNAITTSTRNWLGRLFLLTGAVAGVLACEEPKEIGLPPTTPVGISYTDTLTITRQTIRFDSVRSNDQSSLLVGRYVDPLFGKVQARAFVETRLANDFVVTDTLTNNVTPANRILLDSTRLVLDLNGIWYGDTTRQQEIQIFRLTDSLRTNRNYDISSSVAAESQPLVRQTIRPRPTARDSVNARFVLPESFGRQVLALANTDAGKSANTAAFQAAFRSGLLIEANTSDQSSILGFAPGFVSSQTVFGSYVVVYYHVEGEKSRRQQFVLIGGKRFNQITADRSGTPLANLQRGESLPAAATNDRTFIQPGTGVTTKLTFPTLTNLVRQGRVAINRADLIITPAPATTAFDYPSNLALAEVDENNRLRRVPAVVSGSSSLGGFPFLVPSFGPTTRQAGSFAQAAQAVRDIRTNSYTFNITGYFQSMVTGLSPNTGLAIMTPGSTLFPQTSNGGVSDATQLYLTDRVWRTALDGKGSVRLVVFYTSSN